MRAGMVAGLQVGIGGESKGHPTTKTRAQGLPAATPPIFLKRTEGNPDQGFLHSWAAS
jgi:hypothetical protein